jgi:hypothetical protein
LGKAYEKEFCMAEEKVEVRDINFRQVLPWTELFRGFQVALDAKKLLLAAAGILAMAIGWWVWSWIFFSTQKQPRWEDHDYKEIALRPSRAEDASDEARKSAETRQNQEAWNSFKENRRKWNILHAAAAPSDAQEFTDAGDLASSPEEYKAIQKDIEAAIKDMQKSGETRRTVVVAGTSYTVARKSAGALRTLPWDESRGPNPFLLVTGQAGKPWETGHFGEWLVFDEGKVLLEPLVKFLYPIVYLLRPDTGFLNRLYFLLVTLTTLAVWAVAGAAITRMASVQLARNDKIGMTEALRFVFARYLSFLSAPVFPLVFVAGMVVLLFIFGYFFMIPIFGDIIMAAVWPLVILAGVMMAVVLVGLVGWPMMYATISAEGSDSFDAISRSYSYVYQNPWHYAWYSLVALSYGAVVVFFIGFMGSMVVYLGKWGVSETPGIEKANRDPGYLFVWAPNSFGWRTLLLQGTKVDGQELVVDGEINQAAYNKLTGADTNYTGPDRMNWWNWIGTFLVTCWTHLFFLLVLGFGYSYFWSASTIIYLLMRRKVDDTDIDEVYLEEDETEETYSASTTMPAPSGPPPGSLQMIEAPTLRTSPPPSSSPAPAPAPAHSESAATGIQETPPGDGAKP